MTITSVTKLDFFQGVLHQFLASEDYHTCMIDYLCHTRRWLYDHQSIHLQMHPDGTWTVPSSTAWSKNGNCVVRIFELDYFRERMAEIGETRDFEDILAERDRRSL